MAVTDTPDAPLPLPLESEGDTSGPSLAEQRRRGAPPPHPPPTPGGPSLEPGDNLLNTDWQEIGKRKLLLGTRDVVEGLAAPLIGLADVSSWPIRAAQTALGFQRGEAPSTQVEKWLNAANLPNPETPFEQGASTFNRAAASTLSGTLLGRLFGLGTTTQTPVQTSAGPTTLTVPTPAPTLTQLARLGGTGGAGAEVGHEVAKSDLVPGWAKPTVELGASILGTKGADIGWNVGTKGVNFVAGKMDPVYQAFQRSGVTPLLGATVSGGETGQSVEGAMERTPFASAQVRPAQRQMINDFSQSVDRTANAMDPTRTAVTAQTTGDILQNSGRAWRTQFAADLAAKGDPLNQRMAGTSVDMTPVQGQLTAMVNNLNIPQVQKVLSPDLAARLQRALTIDAPGGTLSWYQVQGLRSLLGEVMGVPEIVAGMGQKNLSNLYRSVSDAMRTTAAQHGQEALFNDFNDFATKGYAFRDGTLQNIITKNNPMQETVAPEDATHRMLQGGSKSMEELRANMPDAADALAAYNLRQAQIANPGQSVAFNDTSTGRFLTNINRMRQQTPEGYDALYNHPTIQQQLDDLSTVAGRLRATERHVNTSGTAEQIGWLGWFNKMQEQALEGEYKKLAATAVGVPAFGIGVGKVLTSPTLSRFYGSTGAGPPPAPYRQTGILGDIPQIVVRPKPDQGQ